MLVAVLGASANPERYANKAVRALLKHGHEVIPVNPGQTLIAGLPVIKNLSEIKRAVDTLTVYVGPDHIGPVIPEIVKLKPKRVILNPGAESAELSAALAAAKIPCLEACTLVLLSTGQF